MWWIDPHGARQSGRLRDSALEALRVDQESVVEGLSALLEERLGMAVVNAVRSHEADAGVAVGVVVPLEELLAVGTRMLDAGETLGELGAILERLN